MRCGASWSCSRTPCSSDRASTAASSTAIRDLDGVTIHDLYEDYPTLAIDVKREQQLLAAHDVIVFQHPFYWYSVPAILKEWQDLVLEHGWAYGARRHHLRGKITFNAITTGGPETRLPEGRLQPVHHPRAAGAVGSDRIPVRHALPRTVRGPRGAARSSRDEDVADAARDVPAVDRRRCVTIASISIAAAARAEPRDSSSTSMLAPREVA